MTDAQNRRRWAIDQQRIARSQFTLPDQAKKLAELRDLAATLRLFPHMADTLAKVEAQIKHMEPRT